MYSYEERIRAVKLYTKLGGRLGATLCKLGYPTNNTLLSWYREYEREQDLQVGYSSAPGKYSAEQKQRAVQHYLDHDQCIASTLRAPGYQCWKITDRIIHS
jgi:transposase-like protein